MAKANLASLFTIAKDSFEKARASADKMGLRKFAECVRYAKSLIEAKLLSELPGLEAIGEYQGMRAWCAVLSFDIRDSTKRALKNGPRDTYITMHTFLPTMLAIVESKGGYIAGLRGDGAIACFGVYEMKTRETKVPKEKIQEGVKQAGKCGDAMVRAVDLVVNPTLKAGGVEAGICVGIGVDNGEIVATNIGLGGAREFTAYGNCVNDACKLHGGNNTVAFSKRARYAFPVNKGGKARFKNHPLQKDVYVLKYEPDYNTIEQD